MKPLPRTRYMLAYAMFIRSFLVALAVSVPALAQPAFAPDCTVDVGVTAGPKLDVTYRCRSTGPLTFTADNETVAAHVKELRDGAGNNVAVSGGDWIVQPVNVLV